MIDFPANPTTGQQFTAAGVTWTWDGTKWGASGLNVAFVPIAGGTMTGPLILAADPTQALQAATAQYADANIPRARGFVNKFCNGAMDVWSRGTSFTSSAGGVFSADKWLALGQGTQLTVSRQTTAFANTLFSLAFTGAAGNTGVLLVQRIESYLAAQLANQIVTFQATVSNNSGSAVTSSLSTIFANTQDNFGTQIPDLPGTPMQTIANGAAAVVSLTFNVAGGARNGYQVNFALGPVTSGAVYISALDIRVTPGWPIGICQNPPSPELRPINTEIPICQRYYQTLNHSVGAYAPAGLISPAGTAMSLPTPMRANPTLAWLSAPSYANSSAATLTVLNTNAFYVGCTVTATGLFSVNGLVSASAEL